MVMKFLRGLGGCTTYTFTNWGYGISFIYISVNSSASTIYCSPFVASPVRLPMYFHFILYASYMVYLNDAMTLAHFRWLSSPPLQVFLGFIYYTINYLSFRISISFKLPLSTNAERRVFNENIVDYILYILCIKENIAHY